MEDLLGGEFTFVFYGNNCKIVWVRRSVHEFTTSVYESFERHRYMDGTKEGTVHELDISVVNFNFWDPYYAYYRRNKDPNGPLTFILKILILVSYYN